MTVTFTPPTGSMGLGNVDIALALTQGLITQSKIEKIDPKVLYAALMGPGGILQQRSQGMGWGDIAKGHGLELK